MNDVFTIEAEPFEAYSEFDEEYQETLNKQVCGAINITYGQFNGYVYFFHGDGTYSRFNRLTCELEYYADIAKEWNSWPADWQQPFASVSWDNQYVYFIRGTEYIRYDMIKDQVDGKRQSVELYWPRWPKKWLNRVDVGLYWGYHFGQRKPKAYFFRDDEYLRYDLDAKNEGVEDGYPLRTKDYWPGWPGHWTKVSAAVDWGNGKVYFFSGMEYLRYDKFFNRVDANYPRPQGDILKEHQEKLVRESKSLMFEDQIPVPNRATFVATVRALAKEFNIRPNWLMASMWMESGFKPNAGLLAGNFIGLHQLSIELIYRMWGKTALPALGGVPFNQLTKEAKRLLAEGFAAIGFDQIHVIGAWLRASLKSFKNTCRSFDQLRLIGFGGVGLGEIDRTPLAPVVAKGNPRYDLNKDGKLDVGEFRAAVFDIVHAKFISKPSADNDIRHDLG